MAGAGYKLFNTGDVLTAADVNTYLMQQTIMVFANAAARDTAVSGVLAQGMQCFLKDTNTMQYYSGSAWTTLSTGGDITSVNAGTGISGGGTTGDVTITNSMATAITTKGDLVPGTGSGTFARLAAGNNGETLVADSAATTGLRWSAQPSASNPVLNSDFSIWQRGASVAGAATTSNYTADRWIGYQTNMTVSRQVTGDTTNLANIQYCARVQRNSTTTGTSSIYLCQPLESINSIPFAGKTVTLSFYARAGANYSSSANGLTYRLQTGTGTDQNNLGSYTGATNPINNTATLTTSWQRFTASATLASTITEFGIIFDYAPTGTAGANDYFEVTGVQVDLGSTALPFRRAMNTLAGELAACQRYYYRATVTAIGQRFGNGQVTSTTTGDGMIQFPVSMRTVPTALEQSGTAGDYSYFSANTATVCSAVPTFSTATTNLSNIVTTVASGLTVGNAGGIRAASTNAYLGWSAEL